MTELNEDYIVLVYYRLHKSKPDTRRFCAHFAWLNQTYTHRRGRRGREVRERDVHGDKALCSLRQVLLWLSAPCIAITHNAYHVCKNVDHDIAA